MRASSLERSLGSKPHLPGDIPPWGQASAEKDADQELHVHVQNSPKREGNMQHKKTQMLIHLRKIAVPKLLELMVLGTCWPGTSSPSTRGPESVCHSVRLLFTNRASMF